MATNNQPVDKNGYFESVHILRGISALLVLFHHNFGWYALPVIDSVLNLFGNLGHLGVTIFFVISGFVLPLSLKKGYDLIDFPVFLAKRFVRIEPTYLLSLALALGLLLFKTRIAPNGEPYPFEFRQLFAHFLYLIPFTNYDWYNEVYWTLAIEFQFYLIIALVYPLWRKGFVASITVAIVFSALYFLSDAVPQIKLFSKAPCFSAGMLCLTALNSETELKKYIALSLAISMAAIFGLLESNLGSAICIGGAPAVIVFWKPPKLKFRFLGTISYSLYVTHYPIVFLTNQVARHFLGSEAHPVLYLVGLGNILLTIGFAALVYRYIEMPTQKLSKRLSYSGETKLARF